MVFIRNDYVFIYYEIRFNIIEKRIDDYYNRKSEFSNQTIFIDTGDLLVNSDLYKFSIQNSIDVELASVKLISLIENFAFSYFDRYETLEDLDHLLNETPFQSKKIRNVLYHNETMSGFLRGVLTAKLLNKNIQDIAQRHLNYLKENEYGTDNINHYLKFIEYLKDVV